MQIAASMIERGEIFVLDIYHRSRYQLVDADGARGFPTWSPDGTQILFHQNDDPFDSSPHTQIYRADSDGSNLRQLTTNASMHPAWSPDGSQIVYTTFDGGDLYLMRQDGNERHLLLDNDTRNTYPVWSPDGTQIAFLGFSYTREVGDWIYVANADGSSVFRLAANTRMEGRPWWSPDGQQIAFVGQLKGDTFDSIFVANLHGELRRLADHVEYAYDVLYSLWSPDGRYIAFEPSNADGLSIVEVATGQITRLTSVRSSYPSWRP
jgi:Tol biopolymer transport system component